MKSDNLNVDSPKFIEILRVKTKCSANAAACLTFAMTSIVPFSQLTSTFSIVVGESEIKPPVNLRSAVIPGCKWRLGVLFGPPT